MPHWTSKLWIFIIIFGFLCASYTAVNVGYNIGFLSGHKKGLNYGYSLCERTIVNNKDRFCEKHCFPEVKDGQKGANEEG